MYHTYQTHSNTLQQSNHWLITQAFKCWEKLNNVLQVFLEWKFTVMQFAYCVGN